MSLKRVVRMARGKSTTLGVFVLMASFALHSVAGASQSDDFPQTCENAALIASEESGVPLDVLRAITLTETGRTRNGVWHAWPWTVNMEGAGKWFERRSRAVEYVYNEVNQGAQSFDVGCFQVNYKWHGKAFTSIEHMFDPIENARYAARFLSELYLEFGDWTRAAGAYHSRTPKYASRYTERFSRIRRDLSPFPRAATVRDPQPVTNQFPLLQRSGSTATRASLVPLPHSASSRLIDISGQ